VRAILAEENIQRETLLRFVKLLARDECICRWRGRELQDGRQPRAAAKTAGLAAMAKFVCRRRVQRKTF
jgi:hypothetical protein